MSSDPENEYFSDGMTEEIINALSRIEGLQVTARTSSFVFKGSNKDIRSIGQELGVALVLEGSIRKAGDRVRITAQLIRTDNGFHIWSENFDRKLTDIFALQDEISLLIAGKIREDFGHFDIQDRLVESPTTNIEAYQLYLKGRFYHNRWNLTAFAEAADIYQQSIDEDPSFDLPYFGAGLSYSFLGSWGGMDRQEAFKLADEYFRQGLLLNTPSHYSYYCVAKHLFWGKWNYKDAYELLLKAYKLNPEHSDTNEFIAEINTAVGDFPTALKHINTSLSLNPLAPSHFYTKANICYLQGEFLQAISLVDKALILEPDFVVVIELKLACQIQAGLYDELKESLVKHQDLLLPELYELMYTLIWQPGEVDSFQIELMINQVRQAQPALLFAWDLFLLIHSGDAEGSMRLLEEKATNKVGQIINFKHDPFLKPLRQLDAYTKLEQQYFSVNKMTAVVKGKAKQKELLDEENAQQYTELLLFKMEKEKRYLAQDLNLRELAKEINLHPNKLSWLLNNKLEKNFSDFVNSYRLKEFQAQAIDDRNSHLSLLGLAYESGFNSKSVFNEYFRKATGLTPRSWVKQQQQD
ncbi:MAG: helix-turn-helix domain-containing protein [Cyanothece sp. SIO1E1]|nr:helix-turn-helix domain-containing protein [Cyanothece sp. SIO1E1]